MPLLLDLMSASGWTAIAALALTALAISHSKAIAWRVTPRGLSWSPDDLPLGNWKWHWLAHLQAIRRDWTEGKDFADKGYAKYGKQGKPFLVPSIFWQDEVVLPPAMLPWLVRQPEEVLSIKACLIKALEFDYTAPKSFSFTSPFHVEALNKIRPEFWADEIFEEISLSVDRLWGNKTGDWQSIRVQETVQHALVQITNRMFVGTPLCRNAEFLKAVHNFIEALPLRAGAISTVGPELLKPIIAWWFARDVREYDHQCTRHMLPLIAEVMDLQFDESDAASKFSSLPSVRSWNPQMQGGALNGATPKASEANGSSNIGKSKTLLEHLSRIAARSGHSSDRDPWSVSSRILSLNFVAVHTSTFAIANAILDIMSPPAGLPVFLELRAEAEEIAQEFGGKWPKSAVQKLVKIDSALRESLRLNTFKARGLERIVIPKEGVILPDGNHLPQGTKVGIAVLALHRDPDVWPQAGVYDALRFCRVQDKASEKASVTGIVNTSETFLAFGHGKHACPGRFIAAYELKLMLAYILMHYDIEPLHCRPENEWASDFSTPRAHELRIRMRV